MAIKGGVGSRNNIGRAIGAFGDYLDPIQEIEKRIKQIEAINLKHGKVTQETISKYKADLEKKQQKEQEAQEKKQLLELNKQYGNIAQKFSANITLALSQAGETIGKIVGTLSGGINSYIQSYNTFLSNITTRLQGTNLSAQQMVRNVSKNLGTSPYLKQTDMINNLNKFVESGIAYNVELRAYVATATSKIASTFNAFDSSLLRLIRIQQADSTVARLGMESLLTKFLNARYEDTSYLSSIGTGNISANLLEAESLMGYKGASEFDYAVQRWLGSMSALGVSSNTINMLSQGLGYLGSGNVSALSSNSALRNLLVMASGGSYGSLLTGGLTAQSASDILQNIVAFGQNIAMSGNNVVKSEFASLFGLSVSDLVSLLNITTNDVKEITSGIVKYETLRQETSNQLATMSKRTSAAEMVSNVLANMTTSLSANIASNPALLGLWTVAGLMESSGLDIPIPVPLVGTLSTANLMKLGAIGGGGLTSLINAASALGSGNLAGTKISAWTDTQVRGNGLATTGLISGTTTSTSAYMGGYNEGMTQNTFQEVQERGAEYTGTAEEGDNLAQIKKILEESIMLDVKNIYNLLDTWNTKFTTSRLFNF